MTATHSTPRPYHRVSRAAAITRVLAMALLVCRFPASALADDSEIVWLSHNDHTLATTMWLQVHPEGHAWCEVRSAAGSDESMQAISTLELAFHVSPSEYGRLRGKVASMGVRGGDFAHNHRAAAGLGAPPGFPTHELGDEAAPAVVAALASVLQAPGIAARKIHQELQQVLREAGLACILQSTARVSLILTRASGGSFDVRESEGEPCVKAHVLPVLLRRPWPAAMVQVRVTSDLASVASMVRVTFDEETPLLVNGQPLEQVTQASTVEATPQPPGMRTVEGKWRELTVQLRPASGAADQLAEVFAVDETILQFPSGIWRDHIAIEARTMQGSSVVTSGKLEFRKGRLTRCRGIRDCGSLTPAVVRGLAAAAYGQCRELNRAAIADAKARSSTFIRVALGRDTCNVALHRKCLFHTGSPNGVRPGLHALLSRLSGAPEEALKRHRTLGFEICDPFR
jgi:hypothetical protein